jgi:ABC-2 type transport system permease protein
MKKENKLWQTIKEGIEDTFFIWKEELKRVFQDSGVMIFFFLART